MPSERPTLSIEQMKQFKAYDHEEVQQYLTEQCASYVYLDDLLQFVAINKLCGDQLLSLTHEQAKDMGLTAGGPRLKLLQSVPILKTGFKCENLVDPTLYFEIGQDFFSLPGNKTLRLKKVFDDKLEHLRVSPLLSDVLKSVSADIEYVNLEQNFLVNIQPVADFTPGMPKVKLINLRFNRIDESEENWQAVAQMATSLSDRKGAVIIYGNPIASYLSRDDFVALYRDNPEVFLRIIWIPENWIAGGEWRQCLDGLHNMQRSVLRAHQEFYQQFNGKYDRK
ncbi:hypothetical protein MP228_010576 [Amoeboaphelidium protococcarum]|nr:hypothetical protein MP228_010576 [Amoeboaphelidium protococcarum]